MATRELVVTLPRKPSPAPRPWPIGEHFSSLDPSSEDSFVFEIAMMIPPRISANETIREAASLYVALHALMCEHIKFIDPEGSQYLYNVYHERLLLLLQSVNAQEREIVIRLLHLCMLYRHHTAPNLAEWRDRVRSRFRAEIAELDK